MKKFLAIIISSFLFISFSLAANDLVHGQQLFKGRCAGCHGILNELTGPALAGLSDRHSEAWIMAFVRNSQQMIESGDETASKIFETYNSLPMPAQKDLSDDDIRSIVAYIKAETQRINTSEKTQKYAAGAVCMNKKFLQLDDTASLLKVGFTTLFVPLVLFGCFFYRHAERISNK